MKTKLLLILFVIGIFSLDAQTTHNLNWFSGIGPNVDLTIEPGDTVIWTWTSPNHSVENDPAGSSLESFDSGIIFPTGTMFSHTFTVVGSNDYYCGVHGAASMSGTITVEPALGVDEYSISDFTISPNPAKDHMNIELPRGLENARVQVFDVLGNILVNQTISGFAARMNVSNWNNGIYMVRLSSDGVSLTKRFIKQ